MKLILSVLSVVGLMAALISATATEDNISTLERRDNTRYVFAHIIVGITSNRKSSADWDADMQRARAYGIDAFALNIGTDSFTDTQLGYAYASANQSGMKVFLSFDFNFWSTGSATAVGQKIAQYASQPAQLMVDGKVFVSSFVGDGLNVAAMRSAAGSPLYFAPNFHPEYGTDMSVVDGALNWMGWPNNGNNRAPSSGQTGTVEAGDQRYTNALGSKGYIAPVSPWFFTHFGAEVSYSKNWLFPGELLWFQRWNQILTMGPRFVEIISWNDFGESHYIGPLNAVHTDDGASKWVNDMPHDGWLDMAKPFIAAYKAGATSVTNYITSDQLIYWYRPQPMTVNCDATDTCMGPANNDSGQYYIGRPNGWQTVSDSVFVVSLLQSAGSLQVASGSNVSNFSAPAGASSFTVPMGVGKQSFTLSRNSQTILSATSLKDIINGCVCGIYNFNAYVGTVPDGISDPLGPDGLTAFSNGLKVSTCSAKPSLGTATQTTTTTSTSASSSTTNTTSTTSKTSTSPSTTTTTTTSSSSLSSSSPSSSSTSKPASSTTTTTTAPTTTTTTTTTTKTVPTTTTTTKTAPTTTTTTTTTTKTTTTTTTITTTTKTTTTTTTSTSPSSTACVDGFGSNNYAGLCSFCCHYGYCPPGPCTCTAVGSPNPAPPVTGTRGVPADGLDASYSGLCSFACNHGYCPSGACKVVN